MDHRRRVNLVVPTVLVGLGVILLLNNVGYTSISLWEVVRLWPILLIAAGLEVLLGNRASWASAVGVLLMLSLIAGGTWFLAKPGASTELGHDHELAFPLGSARTATIVVQPAIGSLELDALSDSPNLAEASIRTLPWEELTEEFVEGDDAHLVLGRRNSPRGTYRMGNGATWAVLVSTDIRTDLAVDLGVGEVFLDLSDLQIERGKLDIGVGQARVALPMGADSDIVVDGGIGTVTVLIPPGIGTRITVDAGLVGRTMPPGFARLGDVYTSPDYNRADHRVDLTLSLGVGAIVVRESSPAAAD